MRFKFAARSASSFNVARAALDKPDGVVREVIFPVAGEQTFEKLVKEAAAGAGQRHARIHTVVRASYGSYYGVMARVSRNPTLSSDAGARLSAGPVPRSGKTAMSG